MAVRLAHDWSTKAIVVAFSWRPALELAHWMWWGFAEATYGSCSCGVIGPSPINIGSPLWRGTAFCVYNLSCRAEPTAWLPAHSVLGNRACLSANRTVLCALTSVHGPARSCSYDGNRQGRPESSPGIPHVSWSSGRSSGSITATIDFSAFRLIS